MKIDATNPIDARSGETKAAPCSSHCYATIVADPPWPYRSHDLKASPTHRPRTWDGPTGGISAKERYRLMSVDAIKTLNVPAMPDAHLYLWTTNSFMVEAHEIARAWGFEPKTILTWVKMKADGTPSMKMGYWFRGATEHVLFCVRGKQRLVSDVALPTAYLWPRQSRHSEKPSEFFALVERASPPPYLEMFARTRRPNWTPWGDQVPVA